MLDYFCHYSTNSQSYKLKRARIGRPLLRQDKNEFTLTQSKVRWQIQQSTYDCKPWNQSSPSACHFHHTMKVLHVSFGNFQGFKVVHWRLLEKQIQAFFWPNVDWSMFEKKRETFEQVMSFHIGHHLCHGQSIWSLQLQPCQQCDIEASEYF